MTTTLNPADLYQRQIHPTASKNPLACFEEFRHISHPDSTVKRLNVPSTSLTPEEQLMNYIMEAENTEDNSSRPIFGSSTMGHIDFWRHGTLGEIATGALWSGDVLIWVENGEFQLKFVSSLMLYDDAIRYKSNRRALHWYFESTIKTFF